MKKKQGAKVAVIGGRQSVPQQYTGTVGGQSTSFATIDSEIKTTHLKEHLLAPPDFIGNSYQGITWRLGFGIDNPAEPEEWQDHEADLNFPLTLDKYESISCLKSTSNFFDRASVNNPEAIWKGLADQWWPGV
jgi:hypothetical protein